MRRDLIHEITLRSMLLTWAYVLRGCKWTSNPKFSAISLTTANSAFEAKFRCRKDFRIEGVPVDTAERIRSDSWGLTILRSEREEYGTYWFYFRQTSFISPMGAAHLKDQCRSRKGGVFPSPRRSFNSFPPPNHHRYMAISEGPVTTRKNIINMTAETRNSNMGVLLILVDAQKAEISARLKRSICGYFLLAGICSD